MLRCMRDVSCANHALRPEDCFVRCCRTARAPCTNSLRKQEFPTFADTEQLLLATGRMFARNHPHPRCELPPLVESPSVADAHKPNLTQ